MNKIDVQSPLVSVAWLTKHIDAPNLIVLDASMPKVGQGEDSLTEEVIPGARFIDLKNKWSEPQAEFPNTMLGPEEFELVARQFGINNGSAIIVYDQHGIYSSARAWYMFRSMGHTNVAVLNGGLPEWKRRNLPTEVKTHYQGVPGDFTSSSKSTLVFKNYHQVKEGINDPSNIVLDARSNDRFLGKVPEPRVGLRSGHIPNSVSLPFGDLLKNGIMKERKDLESIFSEMAGKEKEQELIFSCGSGITACVLALGAEMIDRKNFSVYDGSWTEWGSIRSLPIE